MDYHSGSSVRVVLTPVSLRHRETGSDRQKGDAAECRTNSCCRAGPSTVAKINGPLASAGWEAVFIAASFLLERDQLRLLFHSVRVAASAGLLRISIYR